MTLQETERCDTSGASRRTWTWRGTAVVSALTAMLLTGLLYLVAGFRARAAADETVNAARSLLLSGEPERARRSLDQLLWFQPDHAEALLIAGLCQREEGHLQDAITCFERALAASSEPQLREAASAECGITLLKDWQFDRGERVLRRHLNRHPRSDQVRSVLVAYYRKFRRPDEAIALLEQRWELIPDDLSVLQDLLEAGQVESEVDSISYLEKVHRYRPNQVCVVRALGQAHRAAGNLEKAEALFRKALRLRPGDPQAQLLLAELRIHQGRADAAEKLLDAGFVDTDDYRYWSVRSRIAEHRRDAPQAISLLERALAAKPDSPELLSRKARLLRQQGREDEAAKLTARIAPIAEARFELVDVVERLRLQPPTEEQCQHISRLCRDIGKDRWAEGWATLGRNIDQLRKLSDAGVPDERARVFREFYKRRDGF